MNVSLQKSGITFRLNLDHQICTIQSDESQGKSFALKSLQDANFRGFRYHYFGWFNQKKIDWFGGPLYDRYSIVVFDDADDYISSILMVLPTIKCSVIIVTSRANCSIILRKFVKAKSYRVVLDDATFVVQPCPAICAYCGRTFPSSRLTTEHIIPQKFCDMYMPGAAIKNHYRNKVLTCFECNRKKSDDIWIPMYVKSGWMKYMTPEQVGGYSDIFVQLLNAQYENVVNWIFVKNMQSHTKNKLDYTESRKVIEEQLEFFLRRYVDRKPGEYWLLI